MDFSRFARFVMCTAVVLTANGASAAKLLETGGSYSAERLRLAAKLPTLTQQVAAASCAITSNVDVDTAYGSLVTATEQFDQFIVALRDGDAAFGISAPESNRKILGSIADMEEEWSVLHTAVDAVIANTSDVDSAHFIDDHNLRLLDLASGLAAEVKGVHAHPFQISYADALLIKIAGQQRMLTQKMAKDACEIWTGYNAEAGQADLVLSMGKFEATLDALRNGLPSMGIVAAPNDPIRDNLEKLQVRWSEIRPDLQALVEGKTLTDAQKQDIYHHLHLELTGLEEVLIQYQDYAERLH